MSSREICPASTASQTSSMVMILVMEAGAWRSSALYSNSTRPLSASISRAEAEQLIDELLSLENPYHCPHGRPTIISMSKYEIEKKFKRIV